MRSLRSPEKDTCRFEHTQKAMRIGHEKHPGGEQGPRNNVVGWGGGSMGTLLLLPNPSPSSHLFFTSYFSSHLTTSIWYPSPGLFPRIEIFLDPGGPPSPSLSSLPFNLRFRRASRACISAIWASCFVIYGRFRGSVFIAWL